MDLAFICRQFVIVGAGAAGLMTARELWARGQKGDCR
jgi:predicted flavoprotein YhiN